LWPPGGRCPACAPAYQRQAERNRPALRERGWYHETRWQKLRDVFLAQPQNAVCVQCKRKPANTVDHIEPHKMDEAKFWDWDNLQGMCRQCHSRKTATHDGGFGHKRRA
jgi:5-methylcytosine-specific restriction protein A